MTTRCLFLLCCWPLLNGCSTLGYYAQSLAGHAEVLVKREDIERVLQQTDIATDTRHKLSLTLELLTFAEQSLSLPGNGSYRQYTDLNRPFVVWNVFATPELSFTAKNWCYVFIGCLSYRGYYSKHDAEALAARLKQQGWDVYVGGVAAYSTLGWFKDPLLNTMLRHDDLYLARVIFHELAHQKLYIKNDTEFNEAFADSIAHIGVQRWLDSRPMTPGYRQLQQQQAYAALFVDLLLSYKQQLQQVYASSIRPADKRTEKHRLLAKLAKDYRTLSADWNGYQGFDKWFDTPVNNARLSAVSTYRQLVPAFLALYQRLGNDLDAYYQAVAGLESCSRSQRRSILQSNINDADCEK